MAREPTIYEYTTVDVPNPTPDDINNTCESMATGGGWELQGRTSPQPGVVQLTFRRPVTESGPGVNRGGRGCMAATLSLVALFASILTIGVRAHRR